MHSLRTSLSGSKYLNRHSKRVSVTSGRLTMPIMKSSVRTRDNYITSWQQRSTYFYDASWHTGKTFRQLLKSLDTSHYASGLGLELGLCSNSEFLSEQTTFFLNSLQPFVHGTTESKEKYIALLEMHLSALNLTELEKLLHHLRQLNYNCNITKSTIDDKMYLEYGFCNGPPHTKTDSLLSTSEFFQLIERLHQSKKSERLTTIDLPDITLEQAQILRNQLFFSTNDWMNSDKSLDSILRIARQLEYLVRGEITLENIDVFSDEPGPGKVIQQEYTLLVDFISMYELRHKNNSALLGVLLRDLLEIFLAKKIISPLIKISELSVIQRHQLWGTINKITAMAPDPSLFTPFRHHIKTLLSSSQHFGKIHIIPPAGVALGHAWITPALSIMPDQHKIGIPAGTCYLHSGARFKPGISTINEWPIRWLSPSENEELYPKRKAWLLTVPVTAPQLELAAGELTDEWKRADLPYRFASVKPEKPATGCRISVWHTVEKAMDADTKLLFASFNRGLPLPDSTIELWERLHSFMQWLELIAGGYRPTAL